MNDGVRTTDLPDGLPPGQWITPDPQFASGEPVATPSLWITDDPVPEAALLWSRLLREHSSSGLWPLLLVTLRPHGARLARYMNLGEEGERLVQRHARRPWHAGELDPVPAEEVAAQDAGEILARWWGEVTGQNGEAPLLEPPQLPFDRWPGLAPESPRGVDADEQACTLAEAP